MIVSIDGHTPDVSKAAFVAENATVCGNVVAGEDSSIWFGAVLRAEGEPLRIGARTNIQDNVTVHIDNGFPVTIGNEVTVGHNAVVHGCTVGRRRAGWHGLHYPERRGYRGRVGGRCRCVGLGRSCGASALARCGSACKGEENFHRGRGCRPHRLLHTFVRERGQALCRCALIIWNDRRPFRG